MEGVGLKMGHLLVSSAPDSRKTLQMGKWLPCGQHCMFISRRELMLTSFNSVYNFDSLQYTVLVRVRVIQYNINTPF